MLEIERKKAEEEHRQIQDELRIAKEQKLKLLDENKRLDEEKRSKMKLGTEAIAKNTEPSSPHDEDDLNLEREKLLKEVHLAKEKLALMEKKILKKNMSKKSLDSTDISDDFSPGSIIPQRPQGPKTPMQSPHYASNRRRHTRMSRRHSPVADENEPGT